MHDFQGYFSRTFQDLNLWFPGLSRAQVIFHDFPGCGTFKEKNLGLSGLGNPELSCVKMTVSCTVTVPSDCWLPMDDFNFSRLSSAEVLRIGIKNYRWPLTFMILHAGRVSWSGDVHQQCRLHGNGRCHARLWRKNIYRSGEHARFASLYVLGTQDLSLCLCLLVYRLW